MTGISDLPELMLRSMLVELGYAWHDFWAR